MKLVYVQERVSPNGATEKLSSRFEQPEILIGRGGASHIILVGRRVSLVHAKISQEGERFFVSDLNSLAGVRVNSSLISRAVLSTGDVIHIADVHFRVEVVGDLVTLTQPILYEEPQSGERIAEKQAKALTLEHYLPRMKVLSLVCGMIVLGIGLAYPLLSARPYTLSAGKIASVHKVIEGDCQRCHASPFERVNDRECLNCHTMTEHAKGHGKFLAQHATLSQRCAECHMDHNGDHGLIQRDSRPCVTCHGGMNKLNKNASVLDVASFDSHPQFRVSIKGEGLDVLRVSLDDTEHLIDKNPLKLNHAVHLKTGLRGPRGPETLQCNACHRLSPDRKEMQPIAFEKDCQQCHTLGFDERLPDSQVPHGDAEAVYPALFAEYAKLILVDGKSRISVGKGPARAMPEGTELPSAKDPEPNVQLVQLDARAAEEELFTRTGCFLCHTYQEKPPSEVSVDGSRYSIVSPKIPNRWLTKARFDHGAHGEISCESCHEKVRKSTETRDVLLPSIKSCRECHAGENRSGFVTSDCVQCHAYHKSLDVPKEKTVGISEYIHSVSR